MSMSRVLDKGAGTGGREEGAGTREQGAGRWERESLATISSRSSVSGAVESARERDTEASSTKLCSWNR